MTLVHGDRAPAIGEELVDNSTSMHNDTASRCRSRPPNDTCARLGVFVCHVTIYADVYVAKSSSVVSMSTAVPELANHVMVVPLIV